MAVGQRRPSRSPRSQRSRSADVDCLKKYTERRVEERRHTEIGDTSKLDPSRWIPLPKNATRAQAIGKRSPQTTREEEKRRQGTDVGTETSNDIAKPLARASPGRGEEEASKSPDEKNESQSSSLAGRQSTGRSLSTDVTHVKNEKHTEERRHTECSDPKTIATRWIPQINTSRFRYDASPFARISSGCELTKNAATRWMTLAKNPSPCPIPRMNPERKGSVIETPRRGEGGRPKEAKRETPKWQPLRKFSPVSAKGHRETALRREDFTCNRSQTLTNQSPELGDRLSRLSQRMKELYDFKTENEWPKRATDPGPDNTWISKSSSEEEKNNHKIRRNSQDLEFNERTGRFKLSDARLHQCQREGRKASSLESGDVFDDEYEDRLRRFNDKLRYSEDLGQTKTRGRERRTYSDDYDEKARRKSTLLNREETVERPANKEEKKRNSEASTASRGSYVEVDFSKRDSRTSDASYVSIGNHSAKRGSMECRSTRQILEIPPRRAFSQTEERPATPVPPIEWNDDRYVAMKLMSEGQKRDSTRYKVYLT